MDFVSFIRTKFMKIDEVCRMFQFPKMHQSNREMITCELYIYHESKSAEASYRQNFLSFHLL